MPEPAAIELRGVTASSGGYEILAEADAAFHSGLCSVVMGPAGSGKSTLLKVAAGLVPPDSGTVLWRGQDMARLSRREELAFRAASGFAFQDAALWSDTNILGNVSMPLRVHRPWMGPKAMASAAEAVLHRLGYDESLTMRPAELSAGEQKLVSIARAVVHEPDILFMDDPSSNLDEDAAERVLDFLDAYAAGRRTVIIVANSSELAFRLADRLGVIKNGVMVAFGSYDETLERAEEALHGSLARLRARGKRARQGRDHNGAEQSQRGDV